jgi:hypothetical protein
MRTLVLALVISFALSGCATRDGVREDKSFGVGKWYPVTEEQAKTISRAILRAEGAESFEEDEHYLSADLGWSFGTAGTLVGVWFDARDAQSTGVTVLTRRKLAISMGTGLGETAFHERFERGIAWLRSGRPVPNELE